MKVSISSTMLSWNMSIGIKSNGLKSKVGDDNKDYIKQRQTLFCYILCKYYAFHVVHK